MPMTLPTSNWRGRITASSTSTTRDAFSRVTAVTTHWPYVCSSRNNRMLVIVAVATRLRVDLVGRSGLDRHDIRRWRGPHGGRLIGAQPGGPQPVVQGQIGAQDVDERSPAPSRR